MSVTARIAGLTLLGAILAGCGVLGAGLGLSVGDVQRISAGDAKLLVDSGAGALYDTRSEESYVALHAGGAVSFPEADAGFRSSQLPGDRALIFY